VTEEEETKMLTTLHGELPPNIRDHGNVFGSAEQRSPQAKLAAALLQINQLKSELRDAQKKLETALLDDEAEARDPDFKALKADVRRLKHELATAETEAAQWKDVVTQVERVNVAKRYEEKLAEARAARQKFQELFRDACIELNHWYSVGEEVRRLAQSQSDKLANGHVYLKPELKDALREMDVDPSPLNALKDDGYGEPQYPQSWRRHCAIVPLSKGDQK
jgi:chromosome segregation ATPase